MKILKLIILLLLTANFIMAQAPTTQGNGAGTTGNYSSYFGIDAGKAGGTLNTFMGAYAGEKSTGAGNVAVGNHALNLNVAGANNIAIGNNAAKDTNSGNDNISIGNSAGKANSSGDGNVAIGRVAGFHTTGSKNVFIGYEAGFNASLAGANDQLYIQNSADVVEPLIYGDFARGVVAIDTSYVPSGYKFAVGGKAIAEEVQVMTKDTWPDYVFAEDYKLMPLADLETEIETLGHLPGVPSAEEVETNGHALGRMDAILLEKIEELTLHLIDINKEVKEVRQENKSLKTDLNLLQQQNARLKNEIETLKK